jgi:hypothetical protein
VIAPEFILACSFVSLVSLLFLTACACQIDFISLINDIMYSDSPLIVDALADFLELVLVLDTEKVVSEGRMSQVRRIIQVDEVSFRENFTPEQLLTIEYKEMGTILEDLMSSIGMQRFRFVERQKDGTCMIKAYAMLMTLLHNSLVRAIFDYKESLTM